MGVTLNNFALNVVSFKGGCYAISSEYDVWNREKSCIVHKVSVFGKTYAWTFTCIEDDVSWNDSAAKNLKALGDTSVPLESTLYVSPIAALNVKVVAVDILVENEARTMRRFNVTVKET